ncbi:MAG TPA: hypothetical protein VFN67_06320, partial [Polyangiales bacterium]|nr:hypothetical protein [Polyangiales bacterium]
MGLVPGTQTYARWLLAAALTCVALPVAADAGVPDAGAPADTDAEDAGTDLLAPFRPVIAAPAITLPPAPPAPGIAPIVVGREAVPKPEAPIESRDRPRALVETILSVLTLMALAYMGGHPRVVALERKLGISQVITAGFPFVVLGLVARHPSVGILDDQVLGDLSPLLRIGLGCIGFAAGFRFSTTFEPDAASGYVRTAAYASGIPFVFVAGLCGIVLLWTGGGISAAALRDPVFLRDALILGTAGAMTATSTAEVFRADARALRQVLQLEELAGIIGLAFVAAYFRPTQEYGWQLPGTAWLLVTIGLGAFLGMITLLVMRRPKEGPEFVVLTLGMIAFASGTGGFLRLSPVVVAFLAGTCLALLPPLHKQWIAVALRRLERPIYLLSLVVIGALWQVDDWRGWLLVPVFTIARLVGKHIGVALGLRQSSLELSSKQKQALSIAPIGTLAIAIVVNAQLLYP